MIKLTYCLRRRNDLTYEQFDRYWREIHAPLVAERAEVLRILRYVQLRTFQQPGVVAALQRRNDDSPQPYDGVAELWFDSLESFVGRRSPAADRAAEELLADERNFIDLSQSPLWLGIEEEIVSGH